MLVLDNISITISGRPLIENASINIGPKDKVGLVGHNGTGKSTLVKAIMGDIPLQNGEIIYPKSLRVSWVKQEISNKTSTLVDLLLDEDTERKESLNQLAHCIDPTQIAEIHERLADIDAYSAPARAKAILYGLGFDEYQQNQSINTFSGGMQMRVALAACLFTRPDLLLLDEPSNYLDLEGVLWLEQYIKQFNGSVILISHNRDLLNNCTNAILSLEDKRLSMWRGNYDSFLKLKYEKLSFQQKQAKLQEKKKKEIEDFVTRFRYKASKAKQAQSRLKTLEKLQKVELYHESNVAEFNFVKSERKFASPMIKLENVTLGYGDKVVLKDININIDSDDKVAILGKNGNGKSTFVKFLADKLKQISGHKIQNKHIQIAYFEQHNIQALTAEKNAIEHISQIFPEYSETQCRSLAASWGLKGTKALTKAMDLSGGEKTRLAMGVASANGADLLILDEPTNHLDIDSRQELIKAINKYSGAIIIISHDQHLIKACANRLYIAQNGTIKYYDDSIDQYKIDLLNKSPKKTKKKDTEKNTKSELRKEKAKKRESLSDLKKQITNLEKQLSELHKLNNNLTTLLSHNETYEKGIGYINEISQRKKTVEKKIVELEELWLQYSSEYEKNS